MNGVLQMWSLRHAKKVFFALATLQHSLSLCCDRSAEMKETVSVLICEFHPWLDTPLTWDNRLRRGTIVMCIVVQIVNRMSTFGSRPASMGDNKTYNKLVLFFPLLSYESYSVFYSIPLDWTTRGSSAAPDSAVRCYWKDLENKWSCGGKGVAWY